MTDFGIIVVAIIAAIGSVASTTVSAFALLQSKSTHSLINSRMDELLKTARLLAHAEGLAEGKDVDRNKD